MNSEHDNERRKTPSILLTVREAAHELNLGRNRVYEMCKTGAIPSLRIGNTVRIPREGLHEWIRLQTGGRK